MEHSKLHTLVKVLETEIIPEDKFISFHLSPQISLILNPVYKEMVDLQKLEAKIEGDLNETK